MKKHTLAYKREWPGKLRSPAASIRLRCCVFGQSKQALHVPLNCRVRLETVSSFAVVAAIHWKAKRKMNREIVILELEAMLDRYHIAYSWVLGLMRFFGSADWLWSKVSNHWTSLFTQSARDLLATGLVGDYVSKALF